MVTWPAQKDGFRQSKNAQFRNFKTFGCRMEIAKWMPKTTVHRRGKTTEVIKINKHLMTKSKQINWPYSSSIPLRHDFFIVLMEFLAANKIRLRFSYQWMPNRSNQLSKCWLIWQFEIPFDETEQTTENSTIEAFHIKLQFCFFSFLLFSTAFFLVCFRLEQKKNLLERFTWKSIRIINIGRVESQKL